LQQSFPTPENLPHFLISHFTALNLQQVLESIFAVLTQVNSLKTRVQLAFPDLLFDYQWICAGEQLISPPQ